MRDFTFTLVFGLTLGSLVSITRPAEAHDVFGFWYNLAERVDMKQLERDQARLESDMRRGDTARVNRDLAQVRRDEWWLAVDRRGFQLCPVAVPGLTFPASSRAAVSVVIVNPEQTGVTVSYVVDGVVYTTVSGALRQLVVTPSSTIAYDRGGDFGVERYALSAGVYEFRSSDRGWALVKLRPGR